MTYNLIDNFLSKQDFHNLFRSNPSSYTVQGCCYYNTKESHRQMTLLKHYEEKVV